MKSRLRGTNGGGRRWPEKPLYAMIRAMNRTGHEHDRAADWRAWRTSLAVGVCALLGVWVILALSVQDEMARAGQTGPAYYPWVIEGTSIIVTLVLLPAILWLGVVFPLEPGRWRTSLAAHGAGLAVYSVVHVLAMTGLRSAVWAVFYDEAYTLSGTLLNTYVYELRKDIGAYIAFQTAFFLVRSVEHARLQARAATADARAEKIITLHCGGRELRLPAGELVAARAAGNYVEVRTRTGTHLARITLGGLIDLLREAGAEPVRLHRSHIAIRSAIRELVPDGQGGARARLDNGDVLPVSRNYRPGV